MSVDKPSIDAESDAQSPAKLSILREEIDGLDLQIQALLNARAKAALKLTAKQSIFIGLNEKRKSLRRWLFVTKDLWEMHPYSEYFVK
jgi:hypothetical protein